VVLRLVLAAAFFKHRDEMLLPRAGTEGKATQRLPHLGIHPIPTHPNLNALALPYIGETSLHRTKGFSSY